MAICSEYITKQDHYLACSFQPSLLQLSPPKLSTNKQEHAAVVYWGMAKRMISFQPSLLHSAVCISQCYHQITPSQPTLFKFDHHSYSRIHVQLLHAAVSTYQLEKLGHATVPCQL